MAVTVPRLVVAGTGSNVGKTSLTLGIVSNLRKAGLRVRSFKVGPDFLDPTWLKIASDNVCYNLDGWMTDRDYVLDLFDRKTQDCDIAIIEGVMGMFDGARPDGIEGSTAEIAEWLQAPVLLVVNSWGMAGSIAPMVKGFAEFSDSGRIAGVLANYCGSEAHATLLRQALAAARLPPLAGWIQRNSLPALPSRHLGLHPAHSEKSPEETILEIGESINETVPTEAVIQLAGTASSLSVNRAAQIISKAESVRIGIAMDEAFHFYYPDNLEMLEAEGAQLVEFSPIHDTELPEDLGGIFLGGGYPELHADTLSANESMLKSIREFVDSQGCMYAECGGLMYLSRFIRTTDGEDLPMSGLLPFGTRMLTSLRRLGYTESQLTGICILGEAEIKLRGHEFHYSEPVSAQDLPHDWQRIYSVTGRRTATPRAAGYAKGNILASYIHQHFGSNPGAAKAFVQNCRKN